MQKLAFFDIDGTVFRSSLLIKIVETCVTEGIFPENIKGEYEQQYTNWVNREGTYETYIQAVISAFITHIRGIYYGDFADIGKIVVAQYGKQVYRYTRDLIQDLRAKDYYLVAVSQSPKTVLDEFCAILGFHKVYGHIFEIGPRDLFTGVVIEPEFLKDKARVVERVLSTGDFTREGSIGVGDTETDIPLLDSVDTPICFNPNRILYEYAIKKKWPIIIERKDVVYTL